MRLLFFILFTPFLYYSQSISEFQLISYNKTIIKNYDFKGGKDSLISHAQKYELISTHLGVNNGISLIINDWRNQSGLSQPSQNSNHRLSQNSIIDFSNWESNQILDAVILRQFGDGNRCDTCTQSIFDIISQDEDIIKILQSEDVKFMYCSYYQITFNREYSGSFICLHYRFKRKRLESIILSLDDDVD